MRNRGRPSNSGGRKTTMVQAGSFIVAALGWVQDRPGEWKRYVVRCGKDRKPIVTPLIWVDPECLVCIGCLSQRVTLLAEREPMMVRCLDCHALSEFEPEDVMEEEEDDDEYGSGDFEL